MSPGQWVTRLARLHNAQLPELELLDAYYEGEQPLSYMHPELLRRLDSRLRSVVINWPQLIVGSLDERLDVTGFRLGGEAAALKSLQRSMNPKDVALLSTRRGLVPVGRAQRAS